MSQDSRDKTLKTLLFYWRCVWKYPKTVIGLFLTIPITILGNQFLPPLILARVLGRLSEGNYIIGQPWQSFKVEIISYTLLTLLSSLFLWRIVDIFAWKLEGNIQRDIARQVFNHLIDQSADFHANHFSGSLVSQSNKAIYSYVRIADTTIFGTIPLIVSIILASIILTPRAPLYVVSLNLFAIFYIFTSFKVSKPVRRRSAKHAAAESAQTGYLADALANAMAIKSFAADKFEKLGFERATNNTQAKLLKFMRAHQSQMAYFGSVNGIISAASLVLAIISVVSFNANIETVFLILNYTANIVSQLFQFSNNSLRNYNRSVGDASEMIEILQTPSEILDPVSPQPVRMNRGSIRFKDVVFTHKDADESIFKGLNIHIKPGEKVGLIGHSGSGKTSLTRLLLRFSDIDSGEITIDGQNIASVTQNDLRSSIAYVPQEPLLFHRTIAENIGYGRKDATEQEIAAVARKANAAEFVEKLPKSYETLVGERGIKLSGGQRQRIAISRAMIKNAPILVLDEATSALDSESEALIQDALWKLMENRTAIVIAHRLSTIQKMDRILVLEEGEVVEQGTHRELICQKGVYAKLWERQSGGFLEQE